MAILGNNSGSGKKPSTPTIGTAVDGGTGTTVSVPFTPSTYIGKGTITYTAVSNPGSISATSTSTPITVSGLTTGTSYTFTVKGDTNYGVASDSSAASNSVTPANPASFESIATTVLGSTASSVTFSGIPSTYRHLEIRYVARTNGADNVSDVYFQVNGNTTSIYSNLTVGAVNGTTERLRQVNTANSSMGYIGGNSGTAYASSGIIRVPYYANSSYRKTYYFRIGVAGSGSVNMGNWYTFGGGLAATTSAVSSVTILTSGTLIAGSRFDLYGIKG